MDTSNAAREPLPIVDQLVEALGPGCEVEVGSSMETEVVIEVAVENPVKVAVEVEADVDFEMEVEVEVGERLRITELKSQGA